jgi:hypothetical protein
MNSGMCESVCIFDVKTETLLPPQNLKEVDEFPRTFLKNEPIRTPYSGCTTHRILELRNEEAVAVQEREVQSRDTYASL